MDHLIELRSRLIKALIAFGLAMFGLLLLRQAHLQRPDLALSSGSPAPRTAKFIYTGLLEYFIVQLKLAMFGAAFISFPVWRRSSICSSRPASTATSATRSCPI